MNKYESLIFNSRVVYCISVLGIEKDYTVKMDLDSKALNLEQEEDINLVKYQLVILGKQDECPIEEVATYKSGKWTSIKNHDDTDFKGLASPDYYKKRFGNSFNYYVVDLDFNDRIEKIKFTYKNNIVDPIEISINYNEADKEKYYQKVAAQKRQELLSKMSVSCRTGDSLVNVYWQNATNDVKKTRLELFLDNKQPIMKNEMDADMMFKSVQGLAYGKYYFKLSQYDTKDSLVVTTDLISFTLSRPSAPIYVGKHSVTI